jgi:hypothetical protein
MCSLWSPYYQSPDERWDKGAQTTVWVTTARMDQPTTDASPGTSLQHDAEQDDVAAHGGAR